MVRKDRQTDLETNSYKIYNPAWRCHNNDRIARQFVQPFPREGADGGVPGPVHQGRQTVGNHGGVVLVQLVRDRMVGGRGVDS